MFHDIEKSVAVENFNYLKRHYNIIPLQVYVEACQSKSPQKLPSKALVITFDDGHVGNYGFLPVLKDLQIPITIFLCAGIVNTNRHYWFTKQHPKYSTDELKLKSNKSRLKLLEETGYRPEKEYPNPQALSKSQIFEMKPYVDFQAHTMFHPCLPQCEDVTAEFEIIRAKEKLESEYGLSIHSLAFPNGDHSDRDIAIAKNGGYRCTLTTKHGFNDVYSDPFRIKRVSTNDTTNMDEFAVRVSGLWGFIRKK